MVARDIPIHLEVIDLDDPRELIASRAAYSRSASLKIAVDIKLPPLTA
jgi:hypothetical protein